MRAARRRAPNRKMRARGCNPHRSRSSARFVIIIICGGTRRPKNSAEDAGDISADVFLPTVICINYSTRRFTAGKNRGKMQHPPFSSPDGLRCLRKNCSSNRGGRDPRLGFEALLTSFLSLSLSLSLSHSLPSSTARREHRCRHYRIRRFVRAVSRSFSQRMKERKGKGGERERERERG